MNKKRVLVMFGGMSAEHEVSVVTGLQMLEKLDQEKYESCVVYQTQKGLFYYYAHIKSRKDWNKASPKICFLGRDSDGVFVKEEGVLGRKHYVDVAYLAFHGGSGESGAVQGLLSSLRLPHTGCGYEGSVVAMNKALTKEVLRGAEVSVVPWMRVFADDFLIDKDSEVNKIIQQLGTDLIIKPVHLGSSIGIAVVDNAVELSMKLTGACLVDREVIVERLIEKKVEYNVAVKRRNRTLVCSAIERPLGKDEILSFADKYQRGGKKQGGHGGMASLSRELPAKIGDDLKDRVEETARSVYRNCRLGGMVRIDFMLEQDSNELYVTEINPIPGSMAFYLWEATGLPYCEQITEDLEEAERLHEELNKFKLEYKSDIVEKFVNS
jgi:D-alanine-D-alanine ligase